MSVSGSGAESLEARRQVVYNRLIKFIEDKSKLNHEQKRQFNRTIWRVGELAIADAVQPLIALALENPKASLTNYSIAWSLGRIGDPTGLQAIEALAQSAKHNDLSIRRICLEVRYWLTEESARPHLLEEYKRALPDDVLASAISMGPDALADYLLNFLQAIPEETKESDKTDLIIETLYLLSLDQTHIRKALFKLIDKVNLIRRGNVGAFRTLWKMSEFRSDAEMFANIVRRLETTRSQIPSYHWDRELGYARGMKWSVPYFRRRSWRTLRRLGEIGDPRYIDMAEALLLSVSDTDTKPAEKKRFVRWSWNQESRSYDTHESFVTFSELTSFLALGHILYRASEKHSLNSNMLWVMDEDKKVTGRTEAFRELWDQKPDRLFGLLKKSQCAQVHGFAVTALKDHKDFLKTINIEDWFQLLSCNYEETALLSLDALKVYYADKEPDGRLIRTCLLSTLQPIRDAGKEWLKRASYVLLEDLELLAWMVMSPAEDIRELSREYIHIVDGQEDKQQQMFELLIGKTLEQDENVDAGIIDNVRWVFLNPFRFQLSLITFETVGLFISHASENVNLLGVQILSAQNLKPQEIPPELYGQLFNSKSEAVRAEAVALMSNLKDEELIQWHQLLSNLMISDHALVRKEARTLIGRAAHYDSEFISKILQKILSALFKSETSEGLHDDIHDAFNKELKSAWNLIDKNQLWRMLVAQSKGAQRVAALILHQRPVEDYTVRQWASLGGNPTLSVRAWAWRAYENNLENIRQNIDDALHILSSNWEDSRSFGFNFFSKNFPFDQWSTEQVISLCDNKHKEVQDLGQSLVAQQVNIGHGPKYLMALSEHPSLSMQKFIGPFLKEYASDDVDKVFALEPYIISVLTRVNKGRAAKDAVLKFLHTEALKERKLADMVSQIMEALSLSAAIHDKAAAIEIIRDLSEKYPGLEMPFKTKKLEVRGYKPADKTQEMGA